MNFKLTCYIMAIPIAFIISKFGMRRLADSLTFHPKKYPFGNWDIKTIPWPIEEHWITAADNTRLHCWHFTKKESSTVFLWLHGNGSNISCRADEAITLLENLPVSLFLLSYRGYGRSDGKPSAAGLHMDAMAAYEYVKNIKGVSKVIIYGKSLGGAVGIELASKVNPSGVIVECSFTSLAEVGKEHYPLLPSKFIVGEEFNSIDKVANVNAPKLFIYGDKDDIVPFEHGKRLFEKAKEPKTFYHVKDGVHSDLMEVGGEEYFQKIRDFLSQIRSY